MVDKIQITEYLDIDLDKEIWCCNRCGKELISARENYKKGCLVYERDPATIYEEMMPGTNLGRPDSGICRVIEFYCPGCGTMVENEYLPPGHPITNDIELDIDSLKQRLADKTLALYRP
ncbi:MAG: acetophenone carboxylase [Chloroflexi bacterium]|nr:acetophenone carboxylase [Chloroflexota bacterium]